MTLDRAFSWNAGQGISLAYQGVAPDVGVYEFVPSLILHGTPGNQAIHLTWTASATLPTTSTWRLGYESDSGTLLVPSISLTGTARSTVITGVVNYVWYTVTLRAVVDSTPFMTDTVRVMPTDQFVFVPLVLK